MVTKKDFVLEWDRALGFRGDPFADKVFAPINKFLVDRKDEKEKINWFFIKNYFYGTIVGEDGIGKTTLLRWLEDRLGKYNRVHAIYINAAVFKEQTSIVQKMIIPLLSFYEKTFTKPHKNLQSAEALGFLKNKLGHKSVALLIDNAHHLTENNLELIKGLKKEEGLGLQVIATSTPNKYKKSGLPSLGDDQLRISLKKPDFEQAKEIIIKRVKAFGGRGIRPFQEQDLKKLYDKADKNPKKFLKLCRDEAIKILIHKRETLEKTHLKKQEKKSEQKTQSQKPVLKAEVTHKKSEDNEKKSIKNIKNDEPRKAKKAEKNKSKEQARGVHLRKASDKADENKSAGKGFRIRFALGKSSSEQSEKRVRIGKARREAEAGARAADEDKRVVYDEEHKQELIDHLRSTSPRRKNQEEQEKHKKEDKKQEDDIISETERMLKELAEEFEVD